MKNLTKIKSADGTAYLSAIIASYRDLCEVFGEPQIFAPGHSDGKVTREWVFKTGTAGVITIYDYKASVPAEQNRDWHIGGHGISKDAAEVVIASNLREEADVCAYCGYHITRCKCVQNLCGTEDAPF